MDHFIAENATAHKINSYYRLAVSYCTFCVGKHAILGPGIRTQRKSDVAVGRQDEGDNSDERQQTARYEDICDVVQRSTSHVKSKRHARIAATAAERCAISCKSCEHLSVLLS